MIVIAGIVYGKSWNMQGTLDFFSYYDLISFPAALILYFQNVDKMYLESGNQGFSSNCPWRHANSLQQKKHIDGPRFNFFSTLFFSPVGPAKCVM